MMRVLGRMVSALVLIAAAATPASSQEIDFAGSWVPIYHEDGPERLPGPELADYLGLPINDAARLRADSYDADRISAVSEYQCRQHAADYGDRGLANMRITTDYDSTTQRMSADPHAHQLPRRRADDLSGRPPASVRGCAPQLERLFHRRVDGQHAARQDHAPQGLLLSPQRRAEQ